MVGTPTRYQCSERRRNSSPRLTPTHTGEWLSVMPGYPATRRESCLKRPSRQTPKYRTATISLASCTSEKRNGLRPLGRLKKQSKPPRIGPTITTTSGVRSAAPVTLRAPVTPSKRRSRSTRSHSAAFSAHQGFLGCGQLGAVVGAREQVAVAIGRHLDRGVPEAALHELEGKLEPTIDTAVDAPRRLSRTSVVLACTSACSS